MPRHNIIDLRQTVNQHTMLWHATELLRRSEALLKLAEAQLEDMFKKQSAPAPEAK